VRGDKRAARYIFYYAKKEETSWTLVAVAAQRQAEKTWMFTYVPAFPRMDILPEHRRLC
jgi:hypothetical protein